MGAQGLPPPPPGHPLLSLQELNLRMALSCLPPGKWATLGFLRTL